MNNKEYLNEDAYQKANANLKRTGLIMMIIGAILFIVGIALMVSRIFGFSLGMGIGLMLCIFGASLRYYLPNARKITAYMTQLQMPIAQEGIEKMAPTVGKAGASIAKEMAPVYGEVAKEITKGVREGLKEDEK